MVAGVQIGLELLHVFNRGAQGNTRHQIEGNGDGRQLAHVGNAHRPEIAREPGYGAERNMLRQAWNR